MNPFNEFCDFGTPKQTKQALEALKHALKVIESNRHSADSTISIPFTDENGMEWNMIIRPRVDDSPLIHFESVPESKGTMDKIEKWIRELSYS